MFGQEGRWSPRRGPRRHGGSGDTKRKSQRAETELIYLPSWGEDGGDGQVRDGDVGRYTSYAEELHLRLGAEEFEEGEG